MAETTLEEHKARHAELHKKLDELLADFISMTGNRLSASSCAELMEWSHRQTIEPETEHRVIALEEGPEDRAFKLRWKLMGGHVHVRVYAGKDAEHLGCCGDLTFREDEWNAFSDILMRGPEIRLGLLFRGEIHEGSKVILEEGKGAL